MKTIIYVHVNGLVLGELKDNPVEHLKMLNLVSTFTIKSEEYFIGSSKYCFDNDSLYITLIPINTGDEQDEVS